MQDQLPKNVFNSKEHLPRASFINIDVICQVYILQNTLHRDA